jgi:putative ABC transport system permease protein
MLALIGGALGLLLAFWGVDLLVALNPDNIPRAKEIGIDGRVVAFTLGVSFLTGVLFGLVPAFQASKTDLHETLKEGGRSSSAGGRGQTVRSLLVVSEVAIALLLLVGAGLLIKSFLQLQRVDPGFDPDNLLVMQVSLAGARYREAAPIDAFYQQVYSQVSALPGVESVGACSTLPMSGSVSSGSFR